MYRINHSRKVDTVSVPVKHFKIFLTCVLMSIKDRSDFTGQGKIQGRGNQVFYPFFSVKAAKVVQYILVIVPSDIVSNRL